MGLVDRDSDAATTLIEHLPFEMDAGIAARASIGLIVLATDYTIEYEWRRLFAAVDGVALYHSRILNEDHVTPETLRAMQPRITEGIGRAIKRFKHARSALFRNSRSTVRAADDEPI